MANYLRVSIQKTIRTLFEGNISVAMQQSLCGRSLKLSEAQHDDHGGKQKYGNQYQPGGNQPSPGLSL